VDAADGLRGGGVTFADVIAICAAVGLSFGAGIGVLVSAKSERELFEHIARGAELGAIVGTMTGLAVSVLDALLNAD